MMLAFSFNVTMGMYLDCLESNIIHYICWKLSKLTSYLID